MLSKAVNKELLEPISRWLDDPNFMQRHELTHGDSLRNWAGYKRRQRENNLRAAWEAMNLKQQKRKQISEYQRYVAGLIPRSRGSPKGRPTEQPSSGSLISILTPLSPKAIAERETAQEFRQALSLYISDLLPWRLLIQASLHGSQTLEKLPVHYPEDQKKDKVAKLIHLLQMETEGKVTLNQTKPFQDIEIIPQDTSSELQIKIKDQSGRSYDFDWQSLSDNQRSRIIADLKENRILFKAK